MPKQITEDVLRKTIPRSEEFERYWNGVKEDSLCIKQFVPKRIGSYIDVVDGFKDFFQQYPTAPIYKEKVIRPFLEDWIINIADFFDEYMTGDQYELPHYVESDKTIELLKLLHAREGVSKEYLHNQLGVSEKTIQKDLRAISPNLGKVDYDLKIGGHTINAEIQEQRLPDNRKLFHTPNTVHPLVLFPNVMQVGTILKSLAADSESDISQYVAADIWLQLSDYCKERIKDVYCRRYPELKPFLLMVENRIRHNYLFGFNTERDMEIYNVEEKLLRAYKGNRLCNLVLELDGEIINLTRQKISILQNETLQYMAQSADNTGEKVTFCAENVQEIE